MAWSDSNKFPPFDKGGIRGDFFGLAGTACDELSRIEAGPTQSKEVQPSYAFLSLRSSSAPQLLAQHLTYQCLG